MKQFSFLRRPFYPLLLSVYPILMLYRWNADQLSISVLQIPCLVALTAAIGLWGLIYLFIRDEDISALLTGCVFLQSNLTGHFLEMRSTTPGINVAQIYPPAITVKLRSVVAGSKPAVTAACN